MHELGRYEPGVDVTHTFGYIQGANNMLVVCNTQIVAINVECGGYRANSIINEGLSSRNGKDTHLKTTPASK